MNSKKNHLTLVEPLNVSLRIVIINDAFQQIDIPQVSKIFTQILEVKKAGYQTRHEARFLPVSTCDFFAIHLLICHEQTLEPILVAKIVPYSSCVFYNNEFPLIELQNIFTPAHRDEMKKIISERIDQKKDISYSGGWTINPKFKGLGLSQELRDIYTGIHYHVHVHHQLDTMMGFGAPKVESLAFFKLWGVQPLTANNLEMQPTPLPFCNNLESVLAWVDLNKVSDYKKKMAEKYQSLWNNRLEYSVRKNDIKRAA